MKYLIFIFHLLLFFLKLLLYIILFPGFLIWLIIKRQKFNYVFGKELKKCGLDKNTIKELKKETIKIIDVFRIMKNNKVKNLS